MHTFKLFSPFIIATLFIHAPLGFTYNAHDLEYFKNTKNCDACDFNNLDLSPAILGNDHYNDATLTGTYMYGSTIENLQLQHLNASGMTALGLTLHNNDLTNADFSYSDFPYLKITPFNYGTHPSFKGSTLDYSHFSYTEFEAPDFSGAAMRHASLYHVQWPNANLSEALLSAADLTFANLKGANLQKTILTSALLNHADLSGANLLGAEITADQLKKTNSVCEAILPDGTIGACE
ncbi:MAG: pentapeptide repeat-containing protein [Gammaproteobacteria bacterium]